MPYGQTLFELLLSLTVLFGALFFVPFEIIEAIGTVTSAFVSAVISGAVAVVLIARHRSRVATYEFKRKLTTLRNLPAL